MPTLALAYRSAQLFFCSADLTDRGYIMPGLGDAGDRLFGTR